MFQRLRLSTKLTAVVAVSLVGLFLVTAFSTLVLRESQIGSRRYDEISQTEALIADVLPPPQNIIESYLLVQTLLDAESSADVADLVNRLRLARTEYFDRHDYWSAELSGSGKEQAAIRESLLGAAHSAAAEFWTVVDERFIPAIERGDKTSAESLARVQLSQAYERHRSAIDDVVQLAIARRTNLEASTNDFLNLAAWLLYGFIALLTIGVAVLSTVLVRSIQRPVARLTEVARRTSTIELPGVVSELEGGRDVSNITLSAIDVSATDELGELAAAFDAVRSTAVTLASQQAETRRNINEMFVNLGRRNSSLVNRQLSLIDGLERNEQSEQALEELFRLDHLATRMRRNAESLLVLAGAEAGRRTASNASVVDLIRAALSEVEDYHRVEMQTLDPIRVRGQVVSDVVHLLAELLENAAAFSPPNRPVLVYGRRTNDGYMLSIVDEGIGMSVEQLDEANRRIMALDRFDASPSKVLGLYVVGRLANRHGIAVRLTESSIQGVTARVHLPAHILAAPEHVPDEAPASLPPTRLARPSARDVTATEVAWDSSPPPMRNPVAEPVAREQFRSRLAPPPEAPPAVSPLPVSPPPVSPLSVSPPAGPPLPTRGDDALVRRARGAQLPDTGPERIEFEPADRAPEEVAGMLSRFYRGVAEGRSRAEADDADAVPVHGVQAEAVPAETAQGEATPPVDGVLAPGADEPLRAAPQPRAAAPFIDGDLAPRPIVTFHTGDLAPSDSSPAPLLASAPSLPPTAPTLAPPAPAAEGDGGSGLTRRVRGAQVPTTSGRDLSSAPSTKSPDEVQAMLDRFRSGVQRGSTDKPAGLFRYINEADRQED